jgi:glycosyltransferase involved in cell wall biosynthesis
MKQAASRNPNFHFLGWVEDTTSLYSASNALIYLMDLSNPYTAYNSPNNLYLSIAWALPLIAVNAGEVAAVLTSAKTAILIDDIDAQTVASAVHRLAHEPALYAQCVENLKELQDTFSWASAAESLRSAYAQALRKR